MKYTTLSFCTIALAALSAHSCLLSSQKFDVEAAANSPFSPIDGLSQIKVVKYPSMPDIQAILIRVNTAIGEDCEMNGKAVEAKTKALTQLKEEIMDCDKRLQIYEQPQFFTKLAQTIQNRITEIQTKFNQLNNTTFLINAVQPNNADKKADVDPDLLGNAMEAKLAQKEAQQEALDEQEREARRMLDQIALQRAAGTLSEAGLEGAYIQLAAQSPESVNAARLAAIMEKQLQEKTAAAANNKSGASTQAPPGPAKAGRRCTIL